MIESEEIGLFSVQGLDQELPLRASAGLSPDFITYDSP
jgi:hypothetical protein